MPVGMPAYPAYRPYPPVVKRASTKWIVAAVLTVVACIVVGFVILAAVAVSSVQQAFQHIADRDKDDLTVALQFYGSDAPACAIAPSNDPDMWAVGYEGLGTKSGVQVKLDDHIYWAGGWDVNNDALSELLPKGSGLPRLPNKVIREGPVGMHFLPDSHAIVFASREMQRVIVLSAAEDSHSSKADFSKVTRFEVMKEKPFAIALSPDGTKSAVACGEDHDYSDDGMTMANTSAPVLVLWDVTSGKRLATLEGHKAAVRCVQFMDGETLISGGNDSTLRIWNLTTGKITDTIEAEAPVTDVSCAPDRKQIVYCTERGHVIAMDLGTRKRTSLHKDVAEAPTDKTRTYHFVTASISPDGRWLAVGDHRLKIYDTESLTLKYEQSRNLDGSISSMAWNRNSTRLGTTHGHKATVWKLP